MTPTSRETAEPTGGKRSGKRPFALALLFPSALVFACGMTPTPAAPPHDLAPRSEAFGIQCESCGKVFSQRVNKNVHGYHLSVRSNLKTNDEAAPEAPRREVLGAHEIKIVDPSGATFEFACDHEYSEPRGGKGEILLNPERHERFACWRRHGGALALEIRPDGMGGYAGTFESAAGRGDIRGLREKRSGGPGATQGFALAREGVSLGTVVRKRSGSVGIVTWESTLWIGKDPAPTSEEIAILLALEGYFPGDPSSEMSTL